MTTAIEAARAALSRAMEGSDRTAVTEAARRLGYAEGAATATGSLVKMLREAFDAGCDQGSDEATAADWGGPPRQRRDEAFSDILADWNTDVPNIRAALATGAGDAAEERGDG